VIREDHELLAELARLNTDMASLAARAHGSARLGTVSRPHQVR
jgi:hypothetical protein